MLQKLTELNNLVSAIKPDAAPATPEPATLVDGIRNQLTAMGKGLKEDEDIAVFYSSGAEKMRVFDVESPSAKLVVLHGVDPEGARTTALVPADAIQLVCKFVKLKPGAKRRIVGFHGK